MSFREHDNKSKTRLTYRLIKTDNEIFNEDDLEYIEKPFNKRDLTYIDKN